ncbi:MAG: biotin carboxylase [Bradyrhizobiaceae bacterium PARB1]|nr:MAG: biotin carboxylase [Bradyrhizobiaceae bacterium PARB1]
MSFPFESVLIANRGEIAVRIIQTLRRLGLRSIVVYHEVDTGAPAVALADEAILIVGKTPVAAYLDGEQLLAAAKSSGAGALHPGYGFLSENADFARAVTRAGIRFIGPTVEAIELMGDKIRARAFVARHGFPVAPSAIEEEDASTFVERARAVGAPLLVKPSAGGGGKGMRIVRDLALLEDAIQEARSEGERYFGDGRLYVERFVERPRHIEVQVLGDDFGNVVHLYERECSVQRRFQKIIEETPSPVLSAEEREQICATAAGIARAAGYRNAGTVEFIYGAGAFYFLEMNTRLQVEHPVTEMTTGLDLVAEQVKVAAAMPLSFSQTDIHSTGHAIEARLYAESPEREFTPTTGKVLALRYPKGEGVRVDSGIAQGQSITTAFDPMLAKIIVHAPDREAAIAKARAAIADFVFLGCESNAAFLSRILDNANFRNDGVHTGYLDEHPEIASGGASADEADITVLAAAALLTRPVRDAADSVLPLHARLHGWRN